VPELPDVQVLKQYLDATSLHQQSEAVEIRSQQMLDSVDARQLKDRLQGCTFESTQRYGKYLFVRLDDGEWLMLHFGMTGDLRYNRNAEKEPEYAQILFHFANSYQLAYVMPRRLGEVRVVDVPEHMIEKKDLGPDVLADDFDFENYCQILEGRRGMIKSRLMDRHIMAGIGNVYSDEILFQAGVYPRTPVNELGPDALKRIFGCLKEVLDVATEHGAEPEQFPDSYLTQYRGTDQDCPRCSAPSSGWAGHIQRQRSDRLCGRRTGRWLRARRGACAGHPGAQ
jgi:formamidopyrimidine-DNA glycosylase